MKTKIVAPTEQAYQSPLLIKSLLLSGKRYEPTREIVYRDLIRYDYTTLYQRICRLANVLTTMGIQAGDTVAVMDWDSHRYLEAYFAVPMIGAVLHHVNVRLSPDQISYTMTHAEDDLLLVHDDFLAVAEQIVPQVTRLRGVVQLTDGASATETSLNTLGEYEQLLAAAETQYDFPDFDENSVATTFYTTGTTGNPKGVYFSHRQLVLHTLNSAMTLGSIDGLGAFRSDDVYMPMTPMFHVHAWGVPYVATLLGAKQVYPGRYDPNFLVGLFQREKVTFSHGVPTVLQMILNCEAAKEADLSGWKMLTGGSAPTLGMANEMAERGILFFTAYGMSETCPIITASYLPASVRALPMQEQMPYRIRTGIPVGLVDMQIRDMEGNELPHDGEQMGEIVVRAPWLTQGYFKEPEKSAELWEGGWMHTGDVASIEPSGVLQIKDRIKDVIKTGGEWVSSLEIESLISLHPDVSEVAVVGVPDKRWDERPLARVVAMKDSQLTAELLKAHLQGYVDSGRINKWAIPEIIHIVAEIPKTSVGKINKKRLREMIANDEH
ncbi:fatty acid--CoA ligase [Oceanobacter antarcticus]|uniref:Fatty acid--CoA ligase n=1 Tax=Oceanobacter antarcticus TaxID=3133425 RepID=A0ABW8NFU1_9GAMM